MGKRSAPHQASGCGLKAQGRIVEMRSGNGVLAWLLLSIWIVMMLPAGSVPLPGEDAAVVQLEEDSFLSTSTGCSDVEKYASVCPNKKHLCHDKRVGAMVSKQCPHTCRACKFADRSVEKRKEQRANQKTRKARKKSKKMVKKAKRKLSRAEQYKAEAREKFQKARVKDGKLPKKGTPKSKSRRKEDKQESRRIAKRAARTIDKHIQKGVRLLVRTAEDLVRRHMTHGKKKASKGKALGVRAAENLLKKSPPTPAKAQPKPQAKAKAKANAKT